MNIEVCEKVKVNLESMLRKMTAPVHFVLFCPKKISSIKYQIMIRLRRIYSVLLIVVPLICLVL